MYKSSKSNKIKMTSVCNETDSTEISTDLKYNRTGFKDESNSITENHNDEKPYKMEIVWPSVIVFAMIHLVALYSLYLCAYKAKFLTTIFGFFMIYFTGISITMGVHRYYSHKAFKTNKYVRCFLVMLQTTTAMKSVITWVRDHRTHHKFSETNADPHNSKRGFFFSHIGWLLVRRHPDVIKKGKTIDMSDVEQDPIVRFQKNHYLKIFVLLGVILPTAIPCMLWNETVWNSFFILVVARITGCWNLTWSINSFTHSSMFGSKPYDKNIAPVETAFVSLFTLGEGMHNFHHTFPWDYRASAYSDSITTKLIEFCIKMGWVSDAKCVSQELIKRQMMKKGDSSHPAGHESLSQEL